MRDTKTLARISKYMINTGQTIAIAESVTAGLIMSHFSLAPNASGFFQGGITAYNLGQKVKQLSIEPIHAEIMNCVSEKIAEQMACEVSNLFCSQWGIAVTGYATPVPELKIKSCFAIYTFAHHHVPVATSRIDTKLKGQERVKKYFAEHIINAFSKHITEFT